MTAYGYFDDARREYVITDPRTPVKWINYIGSLAFGGFVDHTGGSLLCAGDPALNRITRYLHFQPASDFRGETLYLRLHSADGFRVASPFFTPGLEPLDVYECHVGLGYSRIVSEMRGLRTEATIFVPPAEAIAVRDIRIANRSGLPVTLDAIPAVEYSHPDALKQFTNADWVPQTMQSRAVREPAGTVILLQYPFMLRETRLNFFTSNLPASSFETDRRAFLGDGEYGAWSCPKALHNPELGDSQALRGDNIAALLHPLGELAPGKSRRLITLLGQARDLDQALTAIECFRDPQAVEQALERLARTWDEILSHLHVATPDPALDRMLNIHNPRQCVVTRNWSRYLSLYQTGLGARSMGVRDTAQDLLGVLGHVSQVAPAGLVQLLSVQRPEGSSMHQFNPLSMAADEGDSREVPGAPRYYSDDHLWLIHSVTGYLKETGDLDFLAQDVPFYGASPAGAPAGSGTVLDHLRRALAFTRGDLGEHGLPRLGFADWNDTVNLAQGAESVFSAELYGAALLEMADLAGLLGEGDEAEQYQREHLELRARLNQHAWDGEWYRAYFDAAGRPLGSRDNAHAQIYLYPQAWAVISALAPAERGRRAMDAVRRRLDCPHGIKLSAPGFDGYDPSVGGITTYPPGAKENGGVFLHTNPWAAIAEAMLGDGDRAYAILARINPAAANERADVYECEPYVYPQNILGDEHPQSGLARNSWLTGTAAWALLAAVQRILGLRPTYTGLVIDPCIPRAWSGFRVVRQFRGAWYDVRVTNSQHVCRGVRSIVVNGRPIDSGRLPVAPSGQELVVEVELAE